MDVSILEKILKSTLYSALSNKAVGYLKNKNKLIKLLILVGERIFSLSQQKDKGVFESIKESLGIFKRLISSYMRGQYTKIPTRTIVSVLVSLLYFVSPFDLIPDWIPLLGFSDDAALIIWVFRSFEQDFTDFITWEKSRISTNLD